MTKAENVDDFMKQRIVNKASPWPTNRIRVALKEGQWTVSTKVLSKAPALNFQSTR